MSPGPSIWSSGGRSLTGSGAQSELDPGAGPGRYSRALARLQSSGGDVAFASFTFDPEEEGSVVVVPERVSTAWSPGPPAGPEDGARLMDDGVEVWRQGFAGALAALEKGVVEKVVLSRRVALELLCDVTAEEVASRLARARPESHIFAVDGLVGASPEMLVSLRNGRVRSLALAGTASSQEALEKPKLRREHHLAAATMESALRPHCADLEVSRGGASRFGGLWHLATSFEGEAEEGATVLDLLASLHPGGSVAGSPPAEATRLVAKLEPWSRGRFAGPVGWFDRSGEGEFALALRCGLLRGRTATLYAGGGIVAGSDETEELDETRLKLGPMTRALGAGDLADGL